MDMNDVGGSDDIKCHIALAFPVDIDGERACLIRGRVKDDVPRFDIGQPVERRDDVARTARHRRVRDVDDLHEGSLIATLAPGFTWRRVSAYRRLRR